MKITIETDDKKIYTEYLTPKELESSTGAEATSETISSSNSADPFSSLLDTAIDNIASSKSNTSASEAENMTLSEIFQKAH